MKIKTFSLMISGRFLQSEEIIFEDLITPALKLARLHGVFNGTEYKIYSSGVECGMLNFTLHFQTTDSPLRLETRVSITPVDGTERKFTTFLEVLCYGLLALSEETGQRIEIRLTPVHEGFVPLEEGVNSLIELTH